MDEFLKKLDLLPEDLRSILIMTVVFAVFWKVIGKSVIQKHLDLFEARERSTVGAESNAEENLVAAQRLSDECEKTLISERATILKSLDPKISAAKAEAAKLVAAAEEKAHAALQKTREELAQESSQLFSSLEARSDELAQQIAERALN